MKGLKTSWSQEDLKYLIANFPHQWNKDLAKHFGIGWRTVVRKARELKLEKAPDFRDHIDFTSFNKGVAPPNKGKKAADYMTPVGLEKMKQNQFKRGNISKMATCNKTREKATKTRNQTIRSEKLRIKYDLPQKTKLKLINI